VTPHDQTVQAVSQGTPAILPGAWLAGVGGDNMVIGREQILSQRDSLSFLP
jgi:hypothetical protein